MSFQLMREHQVGDSISINGAVKRIAMKVIVAFNNGGQRQHFGPYLAGDECYMNDITTIRNNFDNSFTLNYEAGSCRTVEESGDLAVVLGFTYVNKSKMYNKEQVLPFEAQNEQNLSKGN